MLSLAPPSFRRGSGVNPPERHGEGRRPRRGTDSGGEKTRFAAFREEVFDLFTGPPRLGGGARLRPGEARKGQPKIIDRDENSGSIKSMT